MALVHQAGAQRLRRQVRPADADDLPGVNSAPMPRYNPKAIEPRWQQYWEEHKTFRTPDVAGKPKFYVLDMFPYPSGAGLHVGHPEGYTATDILCPLQADARASTSCTRWAGTPSACPPSSTRSRPARTRGSRPRQNIDTFRRQIKTLGFCYDWDREVDTTDPDYFKWTQWIFLH